MLKGIIQFEIYFQFGDKMRESYKTKQKDIVARFFYENEGCFKVEDIYNSIISGGEKIGKVTVYRRVEKLLEEGVIRKFTDDKNAAYYRLVESKNCNRHFHLKCVKCGNITHLDCNEMEGIFKHIKEEHKFAVNASITVLYGLCGKCEVIQ